MTTYKYLEVYASNGYLETFIVDRGVDGAYEARMTLRHVALAYGGAVINCYDINPNKGDEIVGEAAVITWLLSNQNK